MKFANILVSAVVFSLTGAEAESSGVTLIEAFDAAFVRAIESGEYFNTMANVDINILPSDCYSFVDAYPFPSLPDRTATTCKPIDNVSYETYCNTSCFDGAGEIAPACFYESEKQTVHNICICKQPDILSDVLARRTVRIALPIGESDFGNVVPPPQVPPSGPAIDLFESIVARIAVEYDTPDLSIEYIKKFGNDATFTAVSNGEADLVAPFAAIGGLVDVGNGDIRRRTNFKASCGWFASQIKLVVRKNGFSTLQDVRDVSGKVCAYVQFTGITSALFESPDLVFTFTLAEAETTCLQKLASGEADAYLTDSIPATIDEDFVVIDTKLTPATAFWSRF